MIVDHERETAAVTTCRYPKPLLLWDALRALVGLALTTGPLAFLDVAEPMAILLGGIALIFFAFSVKVFLQGVSSVELSRQGLAFQGLSQRRLSWGDLMDLRLAYYAPARRRVNGWYQLTLIGEGHRYRLDSTIEGFDEIVQAAFTAARNRGLTLDRTTSENLATLDRRTEEDRLRG